MRGWEAGEMRDWGMAGGEGLWGKEAWAQKAPGWVPYEAQSVHFPEGLRRHLSALTEDMHFSNADGYSRFSSSDF